MRFALLGDRLIDAWSDDAFVGERGLACPECAGAVIYKPCLPKDGAPRKIVPHFAHKPTDQPRPCSHTGGSGESEAHELAKYSIFRALLDAGWPTTVEHGLASEDGLSRRRADILTTHPDGFRMAVEVQHTMISREEIRERTDAYLARGIHTLWVVHTSKRNHQRHVCIDEISKLHYGGYYTWDEVAGADYLRFHRGSRVRANIRVRDMVLSDGVLCDPREHERQKGDVRSEAIRLENAKRAAEAQSAQRTSEFLAALAKEAPNILPAEEEREQYVAEQTALKAERERAWLDQQRTAADAQGNLKLTFLSLNIPHDQATYKRFLRLVGTGRVTPDTFEAWEQDQIPQQRDSKSDIEDYYRYVRDVQNRAKLRAFHTKHGKELPPHWHDPVLIAEEVACSKIDLTKIKEGM